MNVWKRVTLATINAALAADGIKAELVRAREGYHYFTGDDVEGCGTSIVHTVQTSRYTVEQWVEYARRFKAEHIHKRVRSFFTFAKGAEVVLTEGRHNVAILKGEFTADELEQLAYALRNPRPL